MVTAAQHRGYRTVLKHNVIKPFPVSALYDAAVSIGTLCEYVSPSLVIPHIVEGLKDKAVIAIASEMHGHD